jgi:hypothetical protein
MLSQKYSPGETLGARVEHKCCICGQRYMCKRSYRGIVTEMQKVGGPGWDPLYACHEHTEFEINVWKIKTNRRG